MMTETAHPRDAPMTRAQKFQWHLERGIADGLRRLPASCDTQSALGLVRSLQRQYEILRTTIENVDGDFLQRVHESGDEVTVTDVAPELDVGGVHSALAEDFMNNSVCRAGRFLVQCCLLRQNSDLWLSVIADSTAVDRACYQMLESGMTQILGEVSAGDSGGGSRPVGLQPTELALQEDSAAGREERQRARAYLRQHFATAPPVLRSSSTQDGVRAGRYYRCTMTLDRADEIFARLIEATERLPSAVILGAFAQLICWRVARTTCAVNVSIENRHTRILRTALCATAQRAPIVVQLPEGTLGATAAAAEAALSAGYPVAGRYDPSDLIEERAAAEARRGLCLQPDLAFNFNPPLQGWTALLETPTTEGTLYDASTTRIDVKATNETSYEYGASLSVRWSDTHTARLSIHGDSHLIDPDQCATLLRGIELALTSLAEGNDSVRVADVALAVGLTRVQRYAREARASGIRR